MLNKVMLIGNLGQDPEVKEVAGTKVVNTTLAVTERGYTKKDGTKVEPKTEWFNLQLWGGLADVVSRYSHKGDRLFVEGRFQSRKYTDKENIERTVWEVKVSGIELLSSKAKDPMEGISADDFDMPF